MAKKAIKKQVKKSANQVDFNNSYTKIKESASTINEHLVDTAKVVADDVITVGKQLTGDMYKGVVDTVTNINLENGFNTVKSGVKQVNDFTIDTAEDIVEGAMKNGEQVQQIAAKAMKDSLKLAAKQQEIVFDTLESVKKQLAKNTLRLVNMFS